METSPVTEVPTDPADGTLTEAPTELTTEAQLLLETLIGYENMN